MAKKAKAGEEEYQCAQCLRRFIKGWTDAEAIQERKAAFPGYPDSAFSIVCDDCYPMLMKRSGHKIGQPKAVPARSKKAKQGKPGRGRAK